MKKVFSFLVILTLFSSTGCEKDEDIALSDYVIGEWKTPTMYIHNALPAWYEIEISATTYSMMKTNGTSYIGWPNKSYSVSNKNSTITIKTFAVDPVNIVYKVTLTDDPNMMVWTTEEAGGETFIWEKL